MHIVRTIVWVLLLVALLVFSFYNWETVKVVLWPNDDPTRRIVADTKIPAIVVVSFLIGFVPTWLYHRAVKWKLKRRIATLESAARIPPATDPVTATTAGVDEHPVARDPEPITDKPHLVAGAPREFDSHPHAGPDRQA